MKSQSHRPTVRPSVFLGGDAGGSHSAVAIGREDGTVLGRAEGPGAAMRPGGAAASAVVLADIARRAATQAAASLPVDRAVVGAAGAGRAQEQQELAAALVAAGIARAARVLADAEVALATAFRSAPGIIITAGTGIDALHLLCPAAARRQDQDRHGPAGRPPPLEHRDPVQPRQAKIENDGVIGLGVTEKMPFLAVARAIDRVAGA